MAGAAFVFFKVAGHIAGSDHLVPENRAPNLPGRKGGFVGCIFHDSEWFLWVRKTIQLIDKKQIIPMKCVFF